MGRPVEPDPLKPARTFFEPQLVTIRLGKEQVQHQSLKELEQSLDRVNDAIQNHEAFGILKLKATAEAGFILTHKTDFHMEIGILPILLERKDLILACIEEKRMRRATVFIGYSSEDEVEKEALLRHLGVLQQAGLVNTWSDDQIRPGAYWKQEIDQAITQAGVAILLITANFLTSEFIQTNVMPKLRERHKQGEVIIFPVIAKACAWKTVRWLKQMKVRPKNERPVWADGGGHADEGLAAIAEEVAEIISASSGDWNRAEAVDQSHDGVDKTVLREAIRQRYSLDQVKTFCEDCGIDYDELPYTSKESLVRELIRELERRGELSDLEEKVYQNKR